MQIDNFNKAKKIFQKIAEIESELFQLESYVRQGKNSTIAAIKVTRSYGNDFCMLVDNNDFVNFIKTQIAKNNNKILDLRIELNNI